jgi:hypothetical protein
MWMFEIAIALAVGIVLGYGARAWISHQRHQEVRRRPGFWFPAALFKDDSVARNQIRGDRVSAMEIFRAGMTCENLTA